MTLFPKARPQERRDASALKKTTPRQIKQVRDGGEGQEEREKRQKQGKNLVLAMKIMSGVCEFFNDIALPRATLARSEEKRCGIPWTNLRSCLWSFRRAPKAGLK